jgi:toxin CcdB
MAQFDVYPNPRPESRGQVPYVVDVQSDLLDILPTRLVMPLMVSESVPGSVPRNLCPVVYVSDEPLFLMPHMAAPVGAKLLRKPVATLRSQASDICAASDAVLSGV